jgi:hypothetical protein
MLASVQKAFVGSDGTQYIVDDEVGIDFVQSTDGVGEGMGVEGLAAALGNTPDP